MVEASSSADERRGLRNRLYSLGEEIANSVSHGVGVLLGIAALVLLIVMAVSHGGGVRLAAAIIMGVSLIIEYLFSTLYHALAPEKAKAVFRVLDHCGIYLLIAGSYAPFSLVTLADRGGLMLCVAVWVVAVVGIVAECLLRTAYYSHMYRIVRQQYDGPVRKILLRALGEPDRSRVLMVGDNLLTDIQGGKNAGLDTAWFNPRRLPGAMKLPKR